jgi:hypothetical protein
MVIVLMVVVVGKKIRVGKSHAQRGVTPASAGAEHTARAPRENQFFLQACIGKNGSRKGAKIPKRLSRAALVKPQLRALQLTLPSATLSLPRRCSE